MATTPDPVDKPLSDAVVIGEAVAFIVGALLIGFGTAEMKAIGACVVAYLVGKEDGRRDVK